ncbi:mevalonate kinase [Lichtheimia ornata]|uniref:Mevalonate kinase n=1 Tax=Lichtheimia ornata TaxID=688661 RepID=A0AAD7UQR4_9FUNG|nr:mevalonate kinase [Lichtheimia ornata]KAJ8651693.1 mevalonate kinase [Lichtheimia ornata]
MTASDKRLLISAPGKVILFGEHAVVHKKLAVAASLGLRTYLDVTENTSGECRLKLPDVQVDATWSLSQLDIAVERELLEQQHPSDMPDTLKQQLETLMGETTSVAQKQAVMAFLYLYILLKNDNKGSNFGLVIRARSTLPVGAGLGSSASFSTALATTLLMVFGHLPEAFATSEQKDPAWLETINRYAFKAEQVIHGNPSGVDNAVATFGGALSFRRGEGFSQLEGCKSLRLLLTNTKVPRSTSALVAGVGAKKTKYPAVVDPMLDAIDGISLRCVEVFKRLQTGEMDTHKVTAELEELVDINHCLLHGLGVSHPSLETVRSVTEAHGVKTKLTGAGGGGCAVSIIRDDISEETLNVVTKELQTHGYDCYQTSLGGVGASASILSDIQDEAWIESADRHTLEKLVARP